MLNQHKQSIVYTILAMLTITVPAYADDDDATGQSLRGSSGDTFMEEVVTDAPKQKPKPIPIDLSRVGVSVDPHGNIVPLQNNPNDPWAASGVKPFYNHIETSTTMPYGYGAYPAYGYGGGYSRFPGYGYPGFGGSPFALPGYRGFSGFPAYPAYGYPRYPGFGMPNYGYAPYGGLGGIGYATTGNSATFISNDPITGEPIPQQGNSQTNFTSSSGSFGSGLGFMGGPGGGSTWLTPSMSYQQNSMWKAFNLGF